MRGWPERDELADEGPSDPELAAEGGDAAAILDAPDDVMIGIVERWHAVLEVAQRWPVALEGHAAAQRVMGSVAVVDVAEAIEGVLRLADVVEGRPGQGLGLEGAVEALVLAERLRVQRANATRRSAAR